MSLCLCHPILERSHNSTFKDLVIACAGDFWNPYLQTRPCAWIPGKCISLFAWYFSLCVLQVYLKSDRFKSELIYSFWCAYMRFILYSCFFSSSTYINIVIPPIISFSSSCYICALHFSRICPFFSDLLLSFGSHKFIAWITVRITHWFSYLYICDSSSVMFSEWAVYYPT